MTTRKIRQGMLIMIEYTIIAAVFQFLAILAGFTFLSDIGVALILLTGVGNVISVVVPEGLVLKRYDIFAPIVSVPPTSKPDTFQKNLLESIEIARKIHKDTYGKYPEKIVLGSFVKDRLSEFIHYKLVRYCKNKSELTSDELFNLSVEQGVNYYMPSRIGEAIELEEERPAIKGMLIENHSEETYIDIQ